MSWSLCTCNMPDFQHAICPVHDVPATAGSCPAPRPEPTSTYGGVQVAPAPKDGESVAGELSQSQEIPDGTVAHRQCQNSVAAPPPLSQAPAVPFSLPLRPHGQQNQDNIDDADGWPVIIIYGNPDDPLTLRQMEYVVAAVNSHEELQQQLADACGITERVTEFQIRANQTERRAETAEQQNAELLKAMERLLAAAKELHFSETFQEWQTDLSGEYDAIAKAGKDADELIAKYKRGDQQ